MVRDTGAEGEENKKMMFVFAQYWVGKTWFVSQSLPLSSASLSLRLMGAHEILLDRGRGGRVRPTEEIVLDYISEVERMGGGELKGGETTKPPGRRGKGGRA